MKQKVNWFSDLEVKVKISTPQRLQKGTNLQQQCIMSAITFCLLTSYFCFLTCSTFLERKEEFYLYTHRVLSQEQATMIAPITFFQRVRSKLPQHFCSIMSMQVAQLQMIASWHFVQLTSRPVADLYTVLAL